MVVTDRGRKEIEAAAPATSPPCDGCSSTGSPPSSSTSIGDAAEAVLAALDAPPGAAPTTADGDPALERPTTERT